MKKKANRMPLYSVKKPATSSLSASGRVERHAIGFRHGRNDEDDKGENLGVDRKESVETCSPDEPMPESAGLGFCDFHQAERAGQHQHADDGQPDVQLVADHLGRGAQASQQ